MDLTRPIAYRNFQLNTVVLGAAGEPMTGCQLDTADYYPVEMQGYREKRSLSDGLDASDVFLGARTVLLAGTLYGESRGDFYDRLAQFRATMLATAAFAESPGDLGYLPLTFDEATLDAVNFPSGYIPKMVRVRALGSPRVTIHRDATGGANSRGLSARWDIQMEARDPRIYHQTPITTYFNPDGLLSSGAGTVINRGPYPAPMKIELIVAGGANSERIFTLTAFGSITKITIPQSSNQRIARYDGVEKYLTIEEQGAEVLRMDLLDFPGALSHPLVPAGESSYSWTYTNNALTAKLDLGDDSRFWFWEAWA